MIKFLKTLYILITTHLIAALFGLVMGLGLVTRMDQGNENDVEAPVEK